MPESATQQSDDRLPAKDPDGINELPDLEPGDKILVESVYNTHPNRTLTVEDVEPPKPQHASPKYTLSGYGTEYEMALVKSVGENWVDARMTWPTDQTRVSHVEVLE